MAATFATDAQDELAGLLLYAAYPAGAMTERIDLDLLSVFGTEDDLATVADIEASRRNLPADTEFVPVEGGIHATISREDAQQQIVAATLAQLTRVDQAR